MGRFADRSRSLGPDDTGPSTLNEQMRIISLDGYSEDERQDTLYSHRQTNGATEISFTLADINWRMVDLGGQSLERSGCIALETWITLCSWSQAPARIHSALTRHPHDALSRTFASSTNLSFPRNPSSGYEHSPSPPSAIHSSSLSRVPLPSFWPSESPQWSE